MDKLLRKKGDLIERVCHYPENQVGNVPCFNCRDRTKCNADIFNRLAEYEATGCSPQDVMRLLKEQNKYNKKLEVK